MSPIPLLSFPQLRSHATSDELLRAPQLLEEWLTHYYNRPVVVCCSGSAALHLAMQLVGLQKNNQVLCQDSTYIASCHPILYEGGTPVFVDITTKHKQLDWTLVEAVIEKDKLSKIQNIKAVIFANNYGQPSSNNPIYKKKGITYIEDNAAGFGSLVDGKPSGLQGDYSTLSFNNNKIISGYGGGAIILKNEDEATYIQSIIQHGRVLEAGHLHNRLGYNYRISPLQAATVLQELKRLDEYLEKKQTIHDRYLRLFENTTFQTFPKREGITPNHWLNVFWKNTETTLAPNTTEFEWRKPWYPLHSQAHLNTFTFIGNNNSLQFHQQGICLPSGIDLQARDQERVVEQLLKL